MPAAAIAPTSPEVSSLPILDISKLDNPATKEEFYKELRHLAKDIGFFYLVGHGIPAPQREELLAASKKFFALPQDEKDKIDMRESRHFRGYTKTAVERTRNKPDYREQIDFGEEVAATPQEEIGDEHYLNLYGPNQFPDDTVPELRDLVLNYLAAARALTIKLLRAFLVALELPENSLDDLIGGTPSHLLKLVHYPGNDGSHGEEQWQGVGPHKDACLLTLLWQDSTGGLQVQTLDGKWIDAPPVEGSYVINIGETLEMATGGYLVSNSHQVVMRNIKTSRFSIPYFLSPNLRAHEVPKLPLKPELAAQARGSVPDPLNPLFTDVGKNAIKGRLRSHLEVTKRWYPEEYKILQANNYNLV